jgi:hypothetical protein
VFSILNNKLTAAVITCVRRTVRSGNQWFRWIACRRPLACCICVVAALTLRAVMLPWIGVPEPWVSDEFSYLLGADTFASGRLANPTHPFWAHFETLHVNQLPTYVSKYPPTQALIMAAGQRVFGQPWFGVWISAALMCGSICWMLQGWLPPRSALIGGGLAVIQMGVLGYWVNSYYGGAAAAFEGSLLLGVVPRIVKSPGWRHSLTGGFGLGLLACTRPYEGVFLIVACSVAALLWMRCERHLLRRLLSPRLLLPGFAVTVIFLLASGFYNYRTTGNALLLPYVVNEATYSPVPSLLWQSPHRTPPDYRDSAIRAHWMGWEAAQYYGWRSRPILKLASIGYAGWRYFFRGSGTALIPVGACLWMWHLPRLRYATLIAALFLLAPFGVRGPTEAHYLAPIAGFFFLFAGAGLLSLSTLRYRNQRRARGLPALILVSWLFSFGVEAANSIKEPKNARAGEYHIADADAFLSSRRAVLAQLGRHPARHLVIVHYAPDHNVHLEWVYNRASIDESAIVWARDRGTQENLLLIRYFRMRKVWLLDADDKHPHLVLYRPPFEASHN